MAFSSFNPLSTKTLLSKLFLATLLCSLSYLLGSYFTTTINTTTTTTIATAVPATTTTNTSTIKTHQLDFESHHSQPNLTLPELKPFDFCTPNFTNYCPCQDLARGKLFSTDKFFHRERHCPGSLQKLTCLIPKPKRYKPTFPWPISKSMARYANVPSKKLTILKKSQNWVRLEGDKLVFPGGGTSFPHGVKDYVADISRILPLKSGAIRTLLDIGCGVASFGAALLDYNILTMSIAPVDIHESQVQFALERGLPAMLGILSTYRLPYPSRSFDMAHCSRCLVQWTNYDGLFMMELDRVLRPGGYWVLSGPPIYWKVNYKGWQRTPEDLEGEQKRLEDLLKRMCWKKVAEKRNIAVYRKPTNHVHCVKKLKAWKSLRFCEGSNPDIAWLDDFLMLWSLAHFISLDYIDRYTKMHPCISLLPDVKKIDEISGGSLQKWPRRLNAIPPRINLGTVKGITPKSFNDDNNLWRNRIQHYGRVLESLFKGGYRNIMDMNAGLGGFAAALTLYPVWVMNVVPHDVTNNSLGVIYERGLIGTYMNWCEAFSTYPRTYDLLHADGLFSMYKDKCDIQDIALEMYRILRPHGAVIIRDHVDTINEVKDLLQRLGWNATLSHSERGPLHPEKVLFVDNRRGLLRW
ncbi:hypothetical protein V2J09_002519 [Rumex salicifolius]